VSGDNTSKSKAPLKPQPALFYGLLIIFFLWLIALWGMWAAL
jgi:hypothetical protein